jgi:hypothetical protein
MATYWEEDNGADRRPFAELLSAFHLLPNRSLSLDELYCGIACNWRSGDAGIETALSAVFFRQKEDRTPVRRLRSMLNVLVNNGVIRFDGACWSLLSVQLAEGIISGDTIHEQQSAMLPTSVSLTTPQLASEAVVALMSEMLPDDTASIREVVTRSIAVRRGQPKFRRQLLKLYQNRCAISRWDGEAALEAAHIVAVSADGNHAASNGLILRADIHTLFDLHYLSIHPEHLRVQISATLLSSKYVEFQDMELHVPPSIADQPSRVGLEVHYSEFLRA